MRNADIHTPTLNILLEDLRADRFHVPYFQRGFDWDEEDIRQLMFSLFNDYYIGSFLVWRAEETIRKVIDCESLFGYDESHHDRSPHNTANRHHVVLDGQQRLSAMYYAFFGPDQPLPHRTTQGRSEPRPDRYFINIETFLASNDAEACEDSAFVRRPETTEDKNFDASRAANRDPFSAEEGAHPFGYDEKQGHMFPIRLMGHGDESEWLQRYIDHWSARARHSRTLATEARTKVNDYETEAQEFRRKADDEAGRSAASAARPITDDPKVQNAVQLARDAVDSWEQKANEYAELESERDALLQQEQDALQQVQNAKGKSRDRGAQRAAELRRVREAKREVAQSLEDARATLAKAEDLRKESERARDQAIAIRAKELTDSETAKRVGRLQAHAKEQDTLAAEERERAEEAEQAERDATRHSHNGHQFRRVLDGLRGSFTVPVLEVDESATGESVGAIFQQLNTRGRQVKRFDLLNAVLALREMPLRKDRDEFRARLRKQGLWTGRAEDDIVRMMLMRAHPGAKYQLEERTYRSLIPRKSTGVRQGEESSALFRNPREFETHWSEALDAYERALVSLREEGHYGTDTPSGPRDFVPFEAMLPVYSNLLALANKQADRDMSQRRVRQWYWASVLTERYSSAGGEANSAVGSRDYREVLRWLCGDAGAPEVVRQFTERNGAVRLHAGRLHSAPEMPAPGLMRGVLTLMLNVGPRDLVSGRASVPGAVVETDIVPVDWCRREGIPDLLARSVFNQMLVEEDADDVIRGSNPRDYLARLFVGRAATDVRDILSSHCISAEAEEILMREPFGAADMAHFLRAREAEFMSQLDQQVFDGDGKLPFVSAFSE